MSQILTQRHRPLWPSGCGGSSMLYPTKPPLAEQARIVQLLVERVTVRPDGLEMRLRVEGLASLIEDLRRREDTEDAEVVAA
jgi:hypothetical protein